MDKQNNKIIRDRAQSTLEACVVILAMAVLFTCIANCWTWLNDNMVSRLSSYKSSRSSIGSSWDPPGNSGLNIFR